jgi:hypothetical protein
MRRERLLFLIMSLVVTLSSTGCGRIWGGVTWDNNSLQSLAYTCSYKAFLIGTSVSALSPVAPGSGQYSVSPALPSGLSINSSTGVISGIPTGTTPVTLYTVTAVTSSGALKANVNIQTNSGYLVNDLVHDSDTGGAGCTSGFGTCTIRAAIDSPSPPNIIVLPGGSTILNPTSPLLVTTSTSIYGDCAQGTIINGNNATQLFHITGQPVSLYNMTFENGFVTGANYGGAIESGTVGGGGGGKQLSIYDSNFLNNTALGGGSYGGAIIDWQPLNLIIVGTTFYNNNGGAGGGALSASGVGPPGTATFTNDTFDANTATEGPAIDGDSNYTITSSTFTNNTVSGCCFAAITQGGAVDTTTFSNNLFYNNTGGLTANCHNYGSTTFTSLGNNLTDNNGTDCNLGGSDFLNTPANLGALQNNGGLTLTEALISGSPGIGQGSLSACTTIDGGIDQRGFSRPHPNNTCDIGAYETQP